MSLDMLVTNDSRQARRCGLLVGVSTYEDATIRDLGCCASGARGLHELLSVQPYNYARERLRLLTDAGQASARATRRTMLSTLLDLADATDTKDLLLFYFAGHGEIVDGKVYLLPTDAENTRLLPDTAVPLQRVKDILQRAAARTKVMILDVCHTGARADSHTGDQENRTFVASVLEEAEGIAILIAVSRDELPWSDGEMRQSIFTYYLIEGLRRAAQTYPEQSSTLGELAHYAMEQIGNWAAANPRSAGPALEFRGTGETVLLQQDDFGGPVEAPAGGARPEHRRPGIEALLIAVKETSGFFNRNHELKAIKSVLRTTTDKPLIIQGERGVGKTSLLNRIMRMIDEEQWHPHTFAYCSVEPGSVASCAAFARELWDGLQRALRPATTLSDEPPFAFDIFGRFAAQLGEQFLQHLGLIFVVFIDELDKIFHYCDDLENRRILGLIRYIVEMTDLPIVFVISLVQDLPSSYGSTFPSEKIIIGPFEPPEFAEMATEIMNGYGLLSKDSIAWLYDYTGGYPYFLKLTLTMLFDRYLLDDPARIVPLESIQSIAQAAWQSERVDDIFDDIYSKHLSDDERYLLLWLTSAGGTLSAEAVAQAGARRSGAAKQLRKRRYLAQREDGSYMARMAIMRDWMLYGWAMYEQEIERLRVPGAPATSFAGAEQPPQTAATIPPHGLCIDTATQRVYIDGRELTENPSDLEYRALLYLAERAGHVVTKEELAEHVWQTTYYEGDDQRISALIYRLRDALQDKQTPYTYLETLRKRGFRLKGVTLLPVESAGGAKG